MVLKTNSVVALGAGAAGALSLNLVHETARQVIPVAPHVDFIGMRALGKALRRAGHPPSSLKALRRWTFAGDLVSNTLYYALAVRGADSRTLLKRGLFFGALAGIGAVVLPPVMGLGQQKSRNPLVTFALTIAWYTIGGLAAAEAAKALARGRR